MATRGTPTRQQQVASPSVSSSGSVSSENHRTLASPQNTGKNTHSKSRGEISPHLSREGGGSTGAPSAGSASKQASKASGASSGSISAISSKEFDEQDDLLSDYTSETTFFDEERSPTAATGSTVSKDVWTFSWHKTDGRVHIFGEWMARTKSYRYVVIGPDWLCVIMTYICIVVPSYFVYYYLLHSLAEEIIFFILFGLCIFGLTSVVIADPGLLRKYHHARSRDWTYCDHCESFRPKGTVHCSTCQVCVAGYDHHCPWTGKCIGNGNIFFFKVFIFTLSWLIILDIVLAILDAVGVE